MTYADRYPEQVAGMVLLDTTSPYRTGAGTMHAGSLGPFALLPSVTRLGVGRLFPTSTWSAFPDPRRAGSRRFRDESPRLAEHPGRDGHHARAVGRGPAAVQPRQHALGGAHCRGHAVGRCLERCTGPDGRVVDEQQSPPGATRGTGACWMRRPARSSRPPPSTTSSGPSAAARRSRRADRARPGRSPGPPTPASSAPGSASPACAPPCWSTCPPAPCGSPVRPILPR